MHSRHQQYDRYMITVNTVTIKTDIAVSVHNQSKIGQTLQSNVFTLGIELIRFKLYDTAHH